MKIEFEPIGEIHSPFNTLEDMPIQPTSDASKAGQIVIYEPYIDGLKDLEGFSHIILLTYLHQVRESRLTVVPFLDSTPHGVFATRAPTRPNPIGLSVVKLVSIEGDTLHVENLDMLDGTPLLDIKPYIPDFDQLGKTRIGWLEGNRGKIRNKISDKRFL